MQADVKKENLTVGEVLKKAREKGKKDLVKVSDTLCIRKVYLAALEKGEYDQLPGDAYVYGFIRSYATYLKLDANQLIEQYKAEHGLLRKEQGKDDDLVIAPVNGKDELIPLFNNKKFVLKRYFILSMLAILFILLLYFIFSGSSDDSAEQQMNVVVEETVDPSLEQDSLSLNEEGKIKGDEPVSSTTTSDSKEVIRKIDFEEKTEPVVEKKEEIVEDVSHTPKVYGKKGGNLVLRADKGMEVWIQVLDQDDDGKILISRVLKDGDEYHLNTNEDWYLTVGNSGGLTVVVDGEQIRKFGPNGVRRSNIQLDADKLKAGTAYKG